MISFLVPHICRSYKIQLCGNGINLSSVDLVKEAQYEWAYNLVVPTNPRGVAPHFLVRF